MAEKEYIERETLKILFAGACAECRDSCAEFDGIEADCNQCLLNGVIKDAKSIPAADVRPVVRGHWELSDDRCWHTCSVCGADIDVSVGLLCYVDNEEVCNHNFCPNCGAWMEES